MPVTENANSMSQSLYPAIVQNPLTGEEIFLRGPAEHAALMIRCKHRNMQFFPDSAPMCPDCVSLVGWSRSWYE